MLAVFLFIAFWVLLALGLFFVASRGGIGGARRPPETRGSQWSRPLIVTLVVTYVVFGVGLPILFLVGNHANASKQIGGNELTAAQKSGRELFGQNCAVCHTLAAANATGKVGPNLDVLKPPKELVLNTINNGCLQNPPSGSPEGCLGYGTMPSGILQGRQADEVAAFVAKVAGRE